MEPPTVAASLAKLITPLLAKLPRLDNREIALEVQRQLAERLMRGEHEKKLSPEQLADTISQREASALFATLHDQALRSATDERVRLMAAGAAGLFHPDLDLDRKSRAVRALAQLEPADVLLLRALASLGGAQLVAHLEDKPLGRTALTVAGCLQGAWGGAAHAELTPIGAAVIALVDTWLPG